MERLEHLSAATRLRYLSHVEVAHRRLYGLRSPLASAKISDLRDICKRQQLYDATRQAPPATAADVMRGLEIHPTLGAVAVVQFATATRFGDLRAVVTDDVSMHADRLVINLRHTKTSLTTGPRFVVGRIPTRALPNVTELLTIKQPFAIPPHAYANFLRQVRPDLSAHSLRRGAIQAAMRSTSDRNIMRLTGHRSVESLARYSGVLPKTWAEEMDAAATAIWDV